MNSIECNYTVDRANFSGSDRLTSQIYTTHRVSLSLINHLLSARLRAITLAEILQIHWQG